MRQPLWLDVDILLEVHERLIDRSGGHKGVRDLGLLESALARSPNLRAYEGVEDLIVLAATYASVISANHPFIDGNKRAAFVGMGLFRKDNGLRLVADPVEAGRIFLALAAGS